MAKTALITGITGQDGAYLAELLARAKLGWTAEVPFAELVADMIQADLTAARRDALVAKEGFQVFRQHE